MKTDDALAIQPLSPFPPFIWPDARVLQGHGVYSAAPPHLASIADGDLIGGLLVGVSEATIAWVQEWWKREGPRKMKLVVVAWPAGPTRAEHLVALHLLQKQSTSDKSLTVRILPISRQYGAECELPSLPPSIVMSHSSKPRRSILAVCSAGDLGHDPAPVGSLNLVIRPDDALRDEFRRWFDYTFCRAAPLNAETIHLPHLAPAKGDPEAAEAWRQYAARLRDQLAQKGTPVTVDPKTGEIVRKNSDDVPPPWDGGATALNPLARLLQTIYAGGSLVTVDVGSRIKPLHVPVKAALLDQSAERSIGALTQKQSFAVNVLDDSVEKAVEKCRKVTELIDLLTFPLSTGNRWLPASAKPLLQRELEARDQRGRSALREALGGKTPEQFVQSRQKSIRQDLNAMYRDLGKGNEVPEDRCRIVMAEITKRLGAALSGHITPQAAFNAIAPPDLSSGAHKDNWNQPLHLLLHAARFNRKALCEAYFPRRLSGLAFTIQELMAAMDVFADAVLKEPNLDRARAELDELEEIESADADPAIQCEQVWNIMCGKADRPRRNK